MNHDSIRQCFKEVNLVRRLRHPGVLEVEELFQQGDKLYLQMPYVEGGTLRTWCADTRRRPTARSFRALLYQLTSAVAHIHEQQCIHRDLKPENVLIDNYGRPLLADFEISLDQQASITATLTTRGTPGTQHFMAPELRVAGAVATTESDMYALGVTIEQVTPEELQSDDLQRLTAAMQQDSPASRLSASKALQHAYFAPLFRSEQGEVCGICLAPFAVSSGSKCDGEHFVCNGCFETFVASELERARNDDELLAEHRSRGGRIRCVQHPRGGCTSTFSDDVLARQLPPPLFAEYRAAQDASVEQRMWEEAQAALQRQAQEYQRAHQAKQDRRVLEEGLRRLMPNARQCGSCGRGPVDHFACGDLQAHHRQQVGRARINNACQHCGWFSGRISDWPAWDGQIWDDA